MNDPTRYSSSVEGLEDLLISGRTGCLVSEFRPEGPRVYTMLGQIVAAVTQGDGERWLEILVGRGGLSASRATELRRSLRMGEQGMDLLASEVSAVELSDLREELLKENLAVFLGLPGPAWFEPMTQLFVSNLQVHHDTGTLLSQARQLQTVREPPSPRQPEPPSPRQPEPPSPRQPEPPSPRQEVVFEPVPAPPSERPSSSREVLDAMSAFVDHDRDRSGGQGEFTVCSEHLDVVDLGPTANLESGHDGLRFMNPGLAPAQVVEKLQVCNEVLQAVQSALDGAGVRALPKLQLLVDEDETDFVDNLGGMALDIRGQLSLESLQHALSLRAPSEHRRIVEHGLLDLMERALDLAADQLDDEGIDRVLEEVAGFSHRIRA